MTSFLSAYEVKGKTALITGAGRGIGKGIAWVLAEAGVQCAINARTTRYVEPLVAEMRKAGYKAVSVIGDGTTQEGADAMGKAALKKLGHIDILVNNIGDAVLKPLVALPGKDPKNVMSDADVKYQMDINFMNAVYVSRALGPHLLKQGKGRVINIGSILGDMARADAAVNGAAKAALHQFTKALAVEWAPYGITVNCIAPGYFPDEVTAGKEGVQEYVRLSKKTVPLKRIGELHEVGLLTLYLASEAASYMTGQTIFLDGGMTL